MRHACIRPISFEDYERVAALERRAGLVAKADGDWQHLWTGNPVCRQIPEWPRGWVVETAAGEITGAIANIPLEYELGGERLLVATGRGWVVEPAWRNYAIPLLDHYFRQHQVDLYINTTVNSHSGAAFRAFDCVRVPVGEWDWAGFWVADPHGFAAAALRLRPWALNRTAAAVIRLHGATRALPHARMDIESRPAFDSCFEVFWGVLRAAKRDVLLGVRSREMLNWHFGPALASGNAWLAVAGSDAGMRAYAVFLRSDREGITRMRLADYQSLDGAPTVHEMLRWAFDRCRAAGIHVLEVVGQRQRTPFHRRLPYWAFWYKTHRAKLAQKLRAADAWEPSSFDGDATL